MKEFTKPDGKREIHFGDRLLVRLTEHGETMLELTISNVSGYTDLIGEVRYAAKHLKGLMTMTVRNFSRGWRMERPIRFYEGTMSPFAQGLHDALKQYASSQKAQKAKKMLAPWETH